MCLSQSISTCRLYLSIHVTILLFISISYSVNTTAQAKSQHINHTQFSGLKSLPGVVALAVTRVAQQQTIRELPGVSWEARVLLLLV